MKLKDSIKNLGVALNGEAPEGYYTTELLKSVCETFTGKTFTSTKLTDIINELAEKYEAPVETTENAESN